MKVLLLSALLLLVVACGPIISASDLVDHGLGPTPTAVIIEIPTPQPTATVVPTATPQPPAQISAEQIRAVIQELCHPYVIYGTPVCILIFPN